MRTDSNSILSLPSGVPPKKPAISKSTSNNGEAFASDFNKAKETLSAKKASNTDGSSTSSDSVKGASSAHRDNTSDKMTTSVNEKNTGTESTSDANEQVADTTKGGKALQQEGEGLPANESRVANTDGDEEVSSNVITGGLEGESIEVSPQLTPAASLKGQDVQSVEDPSSLSREDVVFIDGGAAKQVDVDVDGSDKSSGVVEAEVAGLDGVNNSESIKAGVAALSATDSSSGKVKEEGIDPFSADADSDDGVETELSWVLSQMGGGTTKPSTAETSNGAALDATKTTVASGVLAATMDKQGRSEALPSSLLAAGDATLTGEGALDSTDSLLSEEGVLIKEPIELRKKEQEAILSRMAAQIDTGFSDDSSSGGLNSSLHNNQGRPAVTASAINAAMPNAQANNLAMSVPPGHPGWANEMSQKVAWIARDGGHTAHIRLDPPELGSLTVKVSVDSDSNTQINFVAATPQARDLLEGQMGRLREMLAQQGMDLSRADVDVSQQDTSGMQDRANHKEGGSSQGSLAGSDDVDEELISRNVSYVSATGVDYYA